FPDEQSRPARARHARARHRPRAGARAGRITEPRDGAYHDRRSRRSGRRRPARRAATLAAARMISRYSRPEMQKLWGDAHRYETWLAGELAACEAMEELGTVPRGTADAVRKRVKLDPERILLIEATTQHDVIAFLTQVEETAGEPARWLHLG